MMSRRVQLLSAILSLLPLQAFALADRAEPIRPIGADNRPLNLGFEDGTLTDWKPEGEAFEGQPIKGDTVSERRGDQRSNHAGDYWIGGYEKVGDDPRGTLTSIAFPVTHRWASFLVAGGPWPSTRVELVTNDDNKVFFKVSGYENESLRPVIVGLKEQMGKKIFIRIVDQQEGHWGHINFDEFVFYDEKPDLKDVLDPATVQVPPEPDVVQHAGLSPEEAVKAMTLPEGFKATVFAAEPDVVQPIAFTIDERGRLWVVEGITYPQRQPEGEGKDRILIFEDTDNDGTHDKKTVFAENLNLVSGIEIGFGGVWVGAAPYLLFIPDKDKDDKPDGEPQVLLDGWGYQDTHETLNSFIWGPDGWLYGCHGVFTYSNVGKPGAAESDRTPINAGIWRYHPTRHVFEVFAEGTSNPWGLDYDQHGQFFAEACVIPHLWHIIQGARYERQAGEHFNPYTFADIKQSADHVHYAGNQGPHAGNGRSDEAGGGHAHAGLMIYQGDNWPKEYRNKIYIGNIHGQRINVDIPEPNGSGFVARHGEDFLNFNDRWSQVINFRSGPDGGVYFIDWYDPNQCHNPDPAAHDRGNGRIYKVVYSEPKEPVADLSQLGDHELAKLQFQEDEWHVRTARRLLQERFADRAIEEADEETVHALLGPLEKGADERGHLAFLWAAHSMRSPMALIGFVEQDEYPHVAGWAIQFMCEDGKIDAQEALILTDRAGRSKSPIIRRYLASAVQRLPIEQRWDIVAALVKHDEDADDHNLPLMYWYALEPLVAAEPARALKMVATSKIPNLRAFAARRIAAGTRAQPDAGPQADAELLADQPQKPKSDEPRDVSAEFFNGKDLSNWDGRDDVWSVENGEIVGKTETGLPNNEFLKNKMKVSDFRLVFKVKMVPNNANSGVQFRSVPLENSPEMKGYQADIGEGWWGKLYYESGRGLLWDKDPPEGTVKPEEWNTYEILAVGHKIRTAVNGVLCVDLEDPEGELEGLIAPQVHSGGPMEVRFKDFELELNPKWEMKTEK